MPQGATVQYDYDVMVIGGGPTGFIAALGLAQAGVKVCVVEAEDEIPDSPRAAVYHWSVLDGLDRLGIREEAERIGFVKRDYMWLVRKTGEEMAYDLSALEGHTAFPYNIHLGQHQLAGIARDRLLAMPNAEIRFGTSLVTLAQDAESVRVSLEGPEGTEFLACKYLIGADGAGSMVRKTVGLSFDGMTWPERFIATNVFHEFEAAGCALSTMVIDDHWGAIIVKLTEGGLWRCTYMEGPELPERNFMERLPHAYEHFMAQGHDWKLDRAAPYKMHQRCAERFRVGRVVLAGDAAHVTNPTGGYGLTTGLFDAYSLWPTLAAIVLEGGDPALLDIYGEDRRRIYLERTSPRAVANKQLVFHAWGGGEKLENALEPLRAMARDRDACRQGLMFVKSLETVSPIEA